MQNFLVTVQVTEAYSNTTKVETAYGACTTRNMITGVFFVDKYRKQAGVSGHFQAARNMRKQGVPLELALTVLFGK